MVAIYKTRDEIGAVIKQARKRGQSVGLVPTMGGLHQGHLSLVSALLPGCDLVIVSIYVNPTQFSQDEDLATYPRTFEADCLALEALGAQICIFAPDSLYHDDNATMISPQGAAVPLEGKFRPHFFAGVATAVFHLFQAVPADVAIFGEKDFQQLAVIRQMVRDLHLPITIEQGPTIREASGLAHASRNQYLSEDERRIAPKLYAQMRQSAMDIANGMTVQDACDKAEKTLAHHGFAGFDYFVWCDPVTLAPVDRMCDDSRLFVAVRLGKTRLIDNAAYRELCTAQ